VRTDSLAEFERTLALEGIGLNRFLLTKSHEPKYHGEREKREQSVCFLL
jgi:hypothetical protein